MIRAVQQLRGVSVLLVVFAHWNFLANGQIGVDVFFVISGYVVTLSILKHRHIESASRQFTRFLRNRVVRLAPALSGTVIATLIALFLVYPSFEWHELIIQALTSQLWLANLYSQAKLGDYFGGLAGQGAFLHTWSLSVEFQSYIVLALTFLGFWMSPKNLNLVRALLVVLTTLSFLAFALGFTPLADGTPFSAILGYYSPVTRFWEIGFGSLLALGQSGRPSKLQKSSGWLAWVFVAFLAGVASTPFTHDFWRLGVLLAVALTALFLRACRDRHETNLAERTLAFLGDRSYSMYLIHWPILVMLKVLLQPGILVTAAGLVLTLLLAIALHASLEKPFLSRRARREITKTSASSKALTINVATLCILAILWQPTITMQKEIDRLTPTLRGELGQVAFMEEFNSRLRPCKGATSRYSSVVGLTWSCYENTQEREVDFLVVGNSHAGHLMPGIIEVFPSAKVRYFAVAGGIHENNKEVASTLKEIQSLNSSGRVVLLNSFWLIEEVDLSSVEAFNQFRVDEHSVFAVLNDVPEFRTDPVRCKYSEYSPIKSSCEEALPTFDKHLAKLSTLLRTMRTPFVEIDSASAFRLNGSRYSMTANGEILYRDQNHLNLEGSIHLIRWIHSAGYFSDTNRW